MQRQNTKQPDAQAEPGPGSDQQLGRLLQPWTVQEEAEIDGHFVLAAIRWETVFKAPRGSDCSTVVEYNLAIKGLSVWIPPQALGSNFF